MPITSMMMSILSYTHHCSSCVLSGWRAAAAAVRTPPAVSSLYCVLQVRVISLMRCLGVCSLSLVCQHQDDVLHVVASLVSVVCCACGAATWRRRKSQIGWTKTIEHHHTC